jgi:hypothetical protein
MLSDRHIYEYTKTDHFMLRQWERKVDDDALRYVLLRMKKRYRHVRDMATVVVTEKLMKVLRAKGLLPKECDRHDHLVIGICEHSLITVYYEHNLPELLLARLSKKAHVLLL